MCEEEGGWKGRGDGEGEGVGEVPSVHTADSSPIAAKANLFSVITAALFDNPATPVGVPVSCRMTAGLE